MSHSVSPLLKILLHWLLTDLRIKIESFYIKHICLCLTLQPHFLPTVLRVPSICSLGTYRQCPSSTPLHKLQHLSSWQTSVQSSELLFNLSDRGAKEGERQRAPRARELLIFTLHASEQLEIWRPSMILNFHYYKKNYLVTRITFCEALTGSLCIISVPCIYFSDYSIVRITL